MMSAGAKLGRIKPTPAQKATAPHLNDFLKAPLPVDTTPDELDYIKGSKISMGGNDEVGDCTIAASANFFAMVAHVLGIAIHISAAKLKDFYFAMTGGEDSGLPETEVLRKLTSDGIDVGDGVTRRIAVWVRVPLRDHKTLKFLMWKFYAIYLGVELSQNDTTSPNWNMPASVTDDDLPNPENGHAILLGRFGKPDASGVSPLGFVTWGMDMSGDSAWLDSRADEGYALLDEEVASAVGVDWDALLTYVQNVPRA